MLEFGTRILRAQREYQAPMKDGGPPVCFVGGYVMHTSVTEHGVSSVRSLSFNDRVGEVMAADPGATVIPLKVPPAGPERLTRQQR
ncbi:hypothetical protein, partial [Enterococcus faecalis]|uniref:hypothetical protein n=1 Tax=Enterococcus faecalis TaxID=1351 RepID=UPI00403F5F44